ncbi:probable LRR receptor-like serine/threonine-protein kinase At1g05700 [Rosa rugosa]|uniref:probable LRR receptor-like serine/threonine-protein kinase At1g05700 n=1 Tax=Rosa rugosa TaxID=74645 RepID=UPI002B40AB79|nr:probable LRR receptor-like serine/threonine-protein kinase At1g05700 [Rosa rugosa]
MMWQRFKQFFLFAVLGCFALNHGLLVHAQDGQSGFISIDCGLPENSSYTEKATGIYYISDAIFTDTGESKLVLHDNRDSYQHPYLSFRSFPNGTRNCYKISVANGTKYLIRASFYYGNYDGQNELPEFDLHLGPNYWDTVRLKDSDTTTHKELIHYTLRNYIHVCLVKSNKGIPFISAIELRPLPNVIYEVKGYSLALIWRYDTGQTAKEYRYPSDLHDRLWYPSDRDDWTQLNTSLCNTTEDNSYQVPSIVMCTAATPKNADDSLNIFWLPSDSNAQYQIYMHFAEVEKLQANKSRQFSITFNGKLFYGPFSPQYLSFDTIYSIAAWSPTGQYIKFSILKNEKSTLPPILNAYEIYMVKPAPQSETKHDDIDAITNIKSTYKITRNWQGDPCAPQNYSWEGLKCSFGGPGNFPRIISLDLSSSGITGEISLSISNLTMIKTLDLSNNNLRGSIPEFLSQLPELEVLNLEKNNFTGLVPSRLIERRNSGSLLLSLCENPYLSIQVSCKKKKKKHNVVLVVVPILVIVILLLTIGAVLLGLKVKRKPEIQNSIQSWSLESEDRRFTYSELVKITNNFASIIGRGGFGRVYHGTLKNDIQVAVKLLTSSSRQGSKEFQNEVKLLMTAHHRNLVSLIGYCDEGDTMALVFEYVANGNLQQHLSDLTLDVLTWKERLQIAVDAARGLDYLHNGCKPPIVHRDLKASNILLNEKLQAKIADFGLSKVLATESATHISTDAKGTFGYLDAEYCNTGQLNKKSDVYSFGIVLLELITGRAPIIRDVEPFPIHICQWVTPIYENMEIEKIVDSKIQGTYNNFSAQKAIEIAMACVRSSAIQRPEISSVYVELKGCLEIEMTSDQVTTVTEIDESDDDTNSSSSVLVT